MVKEEKLDKYENKNLEQKEEEQLDTTFDLSNEDELKELMDEVNTSLYFNPVVDVAYKVKLTSTNVQKVEKEFEGQPVIKYKVAVETTNANKEEFVGVWEIGKGVMKSLLKDFNVGATFNVTKTGSGKTTKYNVVKDF